MRIQLLLKRSGLVIKLVNAARKFRYNWTGGNKWTGGVRTNYDITHRLSAFAPASAGSLRTRGAMALEAAQQIFPLLSDLIRTTSKSLEARSIFDIYSHRYDADAGHLEMLFNRYGSDKSSSHNYHLLYAEILAPLKKEQLRVLEIGVGTDNPSVVSTMGKWGRPGASLRAFRDFLPHAYIFGADIDRNILFEEERIRTFYVDQTRKESFHALAQALGVGEFELVIDDGLHAPNANVMTMLFAFTILSKAGHFIVEDIPMEAIPIWQAVASLLPSSCDPILVEAKGAFLFMVRRPDQAESD